MHRLPRLLLAVLSVAVLAAAGCGGDDLASKSPQDVLKETFGSGKAVESGKLDLRISLDAKGLPNVSGPLKLALRGPFASSGDKRLPRFDFDVNLDVGGQAVAAGAVSTGKAAWLKFAGQAFAVDAAQFERFQALYARDQKASAARGDQTLKTLGIDPTRWLASPEKAEEEMVGGAETVHVTSKVDVLALLEDVNRLLGRADAAGAGGAAGAAGRVPAVLTDAQRKQIAAAIEDTSLDVYSGKDDGTLRRLNLQVRFDVPPEAREAAGGLSTGTLGLDLVISELNEKQEIVAPKSSRPLSELTGAAGAGAGVPAAPQPAVPQPEAPGAEPEGRYRACIDAAGGSIAEVQKCAPLLDGG